MSDNSRMNAPSEDPAWTRAKGRAAAQRGFFSHLTVYVLVCALLVIIDLAGGTTGATFLGLDWAFWPIAGWGVAVALHAFGIFGPGNGWEERKAAELYEKERQREESDRR